MTTATDLCTAAYREGNLIPVGTTPTAAELAESLGRLNNVLKSLFGNVIGENLTDWPVPQPQRTAPVATRYPLAPGFADPTSDVYLYPPGNSRIISHILSATTVYFPERPNDGARMAFVQRGATATITLDGNGATIEGSTTKAITSGTSTPLKWMYRADTANWVPIATLVAADESPLPEEFDDLLICGLCIRLSARYGHDPREGTKLAYLDGAKAAKARYAQPTAVLGAAADMAPSSQSYGNFDDTSNLLR